MPTPADYVLQFCTAESSSLQQTPDTGDTTNVLFHVEGIDGVEDDSLGERNEAPIYGALGIVSRPLEPTDGDKAEIVCVRAADGLIPIAAKDLRLRMAGNGPGAGTVALVGYGGGFHSLSPVDGDDLGKGTIQVVYCPYDPDAGGVPQKAHTITLDPASGNESISIVHAEGMAITMNADKEILLKNSTGTATILIDDSGITMTGQINLAGGVVIGNPLSAIPLLAGVASPPCSTLFLSP